MPLPSPLVVQQTAALKKSPELYETARRTITGVNDVIAALGPGDAVKQGDFVLTGMGAGAAVSAISGTHKRGRATLTIGTAPSANPTLALQFPDGLWASLPFAIVARNGGTGGLSFTWAESTTQLVITLAGTPTAGNTYVLQWAVRE